MPVFQPFALASFFLCVVRVGLQPSLDGAGRKPKNGAIFTFVLLNKAICLRFPTTTTRKRRPKRGSHQQQQQQQRHFSSSSAFLRPVAEYPSEPPTPLSPVLPPPQPPQPQLPPPTLPPSAPRVPLFADQFAHSNNDNINNPSKGNKSSTLTVSRWRVRCHSGRQNVGEIVHLAVFVVTAPMAPGPMCTKRPCLRKCALGRFRRHSAHGARSNVHQATMVSSHALCSGEAAGIYAANASPRTLTVTRWRVQCHSGRQNVRRRNRALGRFRRHSAHGARSNVHQATMASSHA